MAPLSRLGAAALLVVVVVVAGVLGYRFLDGYTWFDALYMTAITLSTVGFQEVQPLSQVGRLFTMGLLMTWYTGIPGCASGLASLWWRLNAPGRKSSLTC